MFPGPELLDLCGKMTLRTVDVGQLLFCQGDLGQEIFVVLTGTLSVHLQVTAKKRTFSNQVQAAMKKKHSEEDDPNDKAIRMENGRATKVFRKFAWTVADSGQFTGLRREGDSIGQAICFLTDSRRNTSVRALSKSHVMVIKSRDLLLLHPFLNLHAFFSVQKLARVLFNPMLRSDDDLLAIGELLRSLRLFSKMKASELMSLARRVTAMKKGKGCILFQNNESVSKIYFLAEGAAGELVSCASPSSPCSS